MLIDSSEITPIFLSLALISLCAQTQPFNCLFGISTWPSRSYLKLHVSLPECLIPSCSSYVILDSSLSYPDPWEPLCHLPSSPIDFTSRFLTMNCQGWSSTLSCSSPHLVSQSVGQFPPAQGLSPEGWEYKALSPLGTCTQAVHFARKVPTPAPLPVNFLPSWCPILAVVFSESFFLAFIDPSDSL